MKVRFPYDSFNPLPPMLWNALVLSLFVSCTRPGETPSSSHESPDTTAKAAYWNTLPVTRTVIAMQPTIKADSQEIDISFSGNGYISVDPRRNRKIAVRVGGRIERLYGKYNYQHVRKGERLLDLYSPDLSTYVEEYLFIRKQASDTALLARARQKLILLGLTSEQIDQMAAGGQVPYTIPIFSPYEGYISFNSPVSMNADMEATKNVAEGMAGMPAAKENTGVFTTASGDNSIREGMYVNKDQALFSINDLRDVWGIIAFPKETERWLKKGQTLVINSELMPDKSLTARIQFLEQVYQQGQKFAQARVYLPNVTGALRLNSLFTATVPTRIRSLVIPPGSIYYLGDVSIVWVKVGETKGGSNIFQTRVVRTGRRTNQGVEIIEGLAIGEIIARDAGYLTDSESVINH